jgi:catechol 2,3-dioxygenase-like lactoylglutathione lyase family enzyme
MNLYISTITLGVEDVARAKAFYADGLGWPIKQDHGQFVSFAPRSGSSAVALYPRAVLADNAGVAANGGENRGLMFSYVVQSDDRVDAVLAEAERAGGMIVKPGQRAQWGGYFGYFSDPDGYLWKVVCGRYEVDGVIRETEDAFSE